MIVNVAKGKWESQVDYLPLRSNSKLNTMKIFYLSRDVINGFIVFAWFYVRRTFVF